MPSAGGDTVEDGPQERPATRRWCGGARLLVAATVAWTVFLILHILLIGVWWPWFILEATPPLTAVAVPLLLLAVVPLAKPVRRRLSVVLVLLLLAGAHLAGYGPGWTRIATGGLRGTPVKIFAWNTDYWQMSNNKDAFYAFLRRQNADVYLLQEYLYWKGEDQPIRIDDSARLRVEFPGYRLLVQGELVTLSRLPVVAEPHQQLPNTGTDWYWNGTKAQRTDIRVGARTVSFYNVHLPVPFHLGNPLSGRSYRFLKDSGVWWTSELRKLRTDLGGNPNPAVVAGDFNSPWMELSPLGAGARPHSPTGSLLPPRSWPVSEFSLPRLWRLDWLFSTGGLAVPSYHFSDRSKAFSDHMAQQIRIVVP
jgi:endonuclease/exonuclease/phosphatase (EEP) superfamily protein YafD